MQLTTDRLILREFQPSDWPAVLAYQSDERYLRYYAWTGRTPEAVQAFVRMFLEQQQAQPRTRFQLAVTLKADGRLIGNCGVRLDAPGSATGNIGYELDPDYWGRGYATEAARAIVHFGFAELRLRRIWAECVAENAASARVLEKLGMRQEGRLREAEYFKGRGWDKLIYGLLDREWELRTDHQA